MSFYPARPTEFRLKFPKFNKFLNECLPRIRLGKRSFDSLCLPIHSKQRMHRQSTVSADCLRRAYMRASNPFPSEAARTYLHPAFQLLRLLSLDPYSDIVNKYTIFIY